MSRFAHPCAFSSSCAYCIPVIPHPHIRPLVPPSQIERRYCSEGRVAERGAPRQRRATDRTPVGPVAQVPRARLDLQRSLPPPSAAHHHVVGPRAVFTTPLAPTGTIFAASMATIDCHFDFPLLRVRHGLSNPRIHVVRACVPMSLIPSHGRFNTLLPALRVPPRC